MRAASLGWMTGIVYFGGTLYWVVDVMRTYGGLSEPVAVLVAILLASYLAIYPAFFAWLLGRAIAMSGATAVWWAPVFWVATEWARSTFGTGFPWALVGSSQASVLPIVQLASLGGVYGLSLVVALVSTAAAALAISRHGIHRLGAAAVALLLVLLTGWGMWRVSSGELVQQGGRLRVGLVQGSIDQADKWDSRFRDAILRRYIDLSRQTIADGAQIVIWPEASTPFFFDADATLAAPIRRLATETKTPFVIGTDEFVPASADAPAKLFNSAVQVGSDGRSHGTYRKIRLVPFGEYVPLKRLLFFVGPLVEAVSDFSAGTEPVVFDADGRRLSVAICYESVYPSLARASVARGSQLLVTITNDAWFGRSSAAYQHFEQGALRAVEEGRYLVRAANTGISGAVDPYGRVISRTDLFLPLALTVDVRLSSGRTIYSRIGDVVAWAAIAATISMMFVMWVRRRPAGSRRP